MNLYVIFASRQFGKTCKTLIDCWAPMNRDNDQPFYLQPFFAFGGQVDFDAISDSPYGIDTAIAPKCLIISFDV